MSEKLTKDEYESLPWLHVYPQFTYHSPAAIRGTKDGLEALRDAITNALERGTAEAKVIATDGEGYSVEVLRVNTIEAVGDTYYHDNEIAAAMPSRVEFENKWKLNADLVYMRRDAFEKLDALRKATPTNPVETQETGREG